MVPPMHALTATFSAFNVSGLVVFVLAALVVLAAVLAVVLRRTGNRS